MKATLAELGVTVLTETEATLDTTAGTLTVKAGRYRMPLMQM